MIELIKELKKTMWDNLIGKEEAARIIGCTSRNIYRWLVDEITPTITTQNKILRAIKKMNKEVEISKGLIKIGFMPEEIKMLIDICHTMKMPFPKENMDVVTNAKIWERNFKLIYRKLWVARKSM